MQCCRPVARIEENLQSSATNHNLVHCHSLLSCKQQHLPTQQYSNHYYVISLSKIRHLERKGRSPLAIEKINCRFIVLIPSSKCSDAVTKNAHTGTNHSLIPRNVTTHNSVGQSTSWKANSS